MINATSENSIWNFSNFDLILFGVRAHAVAVLPDEWFKDKIVLVGAKLSLEDRHRTPMAIIDDEWEGRMPGVTVMAHAMSQLIEDRKPHKVTTELTFAICAVLGLIGMLIGLAKKVEKQSKIYRKQLAKCSNKLNRNKYIKNCLVFYH